MLEMDACVGKHPLLTTAEIHTNKWYKGTKKQKRALYIQWTRSKRWWIVNDSECGAPIVGILDDAYNVEHLHIMRWRIQKPPCKPCKSHIIYQTNVLLRAPRWFATSRWIYRWMAGQSQDRPLDPSLFLSVQPVSRKALDIIQWHHLVLWDSPYLRSCCLILFKSTMILHLNQTSWQW